MGRNSTEPSSTVDMFYLPRSFAGLFEDGIHRAKETTEEEKWKGESQLYHVRPIVMLVSRGLSAPCYLMRRKVY